METTFFIGGLRGLQIKSRIFGVEYLTRPRGSIYHYQIIEESDPKSNDRNGL